MCFFLAWSRGYTKYLRFLISSLLDISLQVKMGSRVLIDNANPFKSLPSASLFNDLQLAELRECFILFDRTGSGYIEGRDLGQALRALGQNPSEEDITKMLSNANLDAGRLSAGEYLRVIGEYGLRDEDEMSAELKEAFRVFDRKDVGSVDAEELKNALKIYGDKFGDEDIEKMIGIAGLRDNGSLDYLELTSKLIAK